ncbi:glycerophosphodiester phosphodiesterase [Streptomyces sp. NPDC086838]|jgi:glycerophosphoryl diester phosphodiesterase|uniref:glycerophosphodiester phosphodiesterase n=1 Tax=Streptomyces sp. NPDC086838 TaxID=3365762 RepID=UPI003812DC68
MRHLFGGSTSDYAMERVGNQLLLRPGATGTVWDALTGGTQLTDLTDLGGTPTASVIAAADGAVTFYGPDEVTTCFIDFGYGRRYSLIAADIAGTVASRVDGVVAAAADDATAKADAAQTAAVAAAASAAAVLYLPNAITTVDSIIDPATPVAPVYFAHRGGGMVRPEHTLAAYRAAAAMRYPLEISAGVDASGEAWCLHDPTVDRTTNRTGLLSSYTTEEIAQQIQTNSRPLLGAGWAEQRLVPLRQVLDEFLGKVPILLEAKANDAVVPIQQLLDASYPHAPRSVIWKAHIGTLSLPWAKARGYRTWVYLDSTTTDATMDGKDSNVDYWGVNTTFTDARISQVVARGKPVFAWAVYRRSQVARLTGLGVVGMMSSDPRYVSTSAPQRTASRWDLQIKESGCTPTIDYDETYALQFAPSPDVGWVSVSALPFQSVGMGTYCPVQAGTGGYRLSFDMKFKVLPASTLHGGIYFGKASDDPYRFSQANATGGYHLVMRANGQLQLNKHTAGVTAGTTMGTAIQTTAPVADAAMSFQVDVTPTTVEVRRTDGAGWTTGALADTTYRGLYFGLSNGSITDAATRPYWRNLSVTQL